MSSMRADLRTPSPGKRRWRRPATGAAALVVVMVLFFIMSLVAAYASRSLIFEQRTSANNYRSTKAFEAAEAGLEWTLAMLNGGRIDTACTPTADGVSSTFRDRYLVADASGTIAVRKWFDADGTETPFTVACVRTASGGINGWSCSCPVSGVASLSAPGGSVAAPTFRVSFVAYGAQPGLVLIRSQGCSNFGSECDGGAAARADANYEVSAIAGLAPALAQPPAASLTVRGGLAPGSASFKADVPGAVAINSGGSIAPAIQDAQLVVAPGSPVDAVRSRLVVGSDSTLAVTATPELSAGERFFLGTFGVLPAALRAQPAVFRLECGDDCREALQSAAAAHPGRVLWIDGDLRIGAGGPLVLGSLGAPVILVVDGNLDFADGSQATLDGIVYSRGTQWHTGAGASVQLRGAFIAEGGDDPSAGAADGHFTLTGAPQLSYTPEVIEHARAVVARRVLDFGSFARVPGSWRDFR